mgnify:FL=1
MSVDEVYKLMQFIINKNQSGYLSPSEFNIVINQAQRNYFDLLLGELQQYQYQRPQPRIGYSSNENSRNRLTPLIVGATLAVDLAGFSLYPDDYEQLDTMWTVSGYNKIRYAENNRLTSYLSSVIDPIESNPIYIIEQNGFRFFPNNIGQAVLYYVKTPSIINWAFTLDVNGRPIYNQLLSTQPVWHEQDMMQIISRALAMVGVNLQAPQLIQYSNDIKQVGD